MRRTARLPVLIAGLVAVCLGAVVYATGALGGLERDSLAARFSLRHAQPPHDIAVVAIDDRTFQDLPARDAHWPFRRSLHAAMVDRLRRAGAREIVYDIQFTERTSEREDLALYESLARAGGGVLATSETDGHGHTNVLGGDANLARIHARAGAANLGDDVGALVTQVPYRVGGLKTLAVAAAERSTGRAVAPGPFGRRGAIIDYRGGPGSVPTYSFSAVLDGHVPASAFRGRIVVVGVSAPTLQDVHATPTSGRELMSGPEIQANAIWTVLHGVPLRPAPGPLNLALVALLGLVAPLARLRLRVLPALLVAIAVGLLYALAAKLAFDAGLILAMVAPLVALAVGTSGMAVASHLVETLERLRVARDNELLEARVRERTEELRETQLEVIQRLGQAAESRDEDTGQHIDRIGRMCERLGRAAGMPEADAEMLRHASAMHDVGKIGIPDRVLLKPGRLDEDEWRIMRTHPAIGAEILAGSRWPVVQMGETIARTHHERWDGTGYPAGLKGEEIPLVGRIVAICDVFDALLSERPYKQAWPLSDALEEIRSQRGRHFDPRLVELFTEIARELHGDIGYNGRARVPEPIAS